MPEIVLHDRGPTALWVGTRRGPGDAEGHRAAPEPGGDWRCLAIGPGRWLFVASRADLDGPPPDAGGAFAFTDVSHGWVRIDMEGQGTEDLLAGGCEYARGPDARPAFMRFLGVPALLDPTAAGVRLYVARSYAPWVHERLLHARTSMAPGPRS